MRRMLLLLSLTVVVVILIVVTPRVYAPSLVSTPSAVSATPLPEGFTLIPVFTPSFPCELQDVDVYDDTLCRSERLIETAVLENEQTVLYTRDYHVGRGCWTGINTDVRDLRVCDRNSGEITTLVDHVVGNLVPSPDGQAYAFVVANLGESRESDVTNFILDVYRVFADGSALQQLDTADLPEGTAGAQITGWSEDGEWLELSLWDGTEGGWYPHHLRTDGSGEIEVMS